MKVEQISEGGSVIRTNKTETKYVIDCTSVDFEKWATKKDPKNGHATVRYPLANEYFEEIKAGLMAAANSFGPKGKDTAGGVSIYREETGIKPRNKILNAFFTELQMGDIETECLKTLTSEEITKAAQNPEAFMEAAIALREKSKKREGIQGEPKYRSATETDGSMDDK